jgi:hypothetical protein
MLLRNISLTILLCGAALAAEPVTVKGVIMDTHCAPQAEVRVLSTGITGGMVVAEAHERECLLKAECEKSGYGIFTRDQKFLAFDREGSQKALAAIRASKRLVDFEAEVTGEVTGDTIKVRSLKLLAEE